MDSDILYAGRMVFGRYRDALYSVSAVPVYDVQVQIYSAHRVFGVERDAALL